LIEKLVSYLSKNSDGTGVLLIDDLEIQLVAGSGSTLSGKFKASSLNVTTNCSSGNLYTLSGPFIHISGFDDIFNVGQSYTITQMSNLIKNAYISMGFSTCESSSSCEMLGIGRVDVYQRGYDSSGSFINFNRDYAGLFKCAENNPLNLTNFIRYSLNANGCGQL
jgi:hypothetical protein